MSIEQNFDITFVAAQALREKQIQQNYRPIIAVHKWFARRPGTLFRALILSEFCSEPLADAFYKSNAFPGRVVADPFMGGGTPLLEANRVGCDVVGLDINPMAVWVVREEIQHLDVSQYKATAASMIRQLSEDIGDYYCTRCTKCGTETFAKYFLWVKVQTCDRCELDFDLFPGHLLAKGIRHPKHVVVCCGCGMLNETARLDLPGSCARCGLELRLQGTAKGKKCRCPHCGEVTSYPKLPVAVPRHRMFAIEYHCARCKPRHIGRFFKTPDAEDLAKFAAAEARWSQTPAEFAPTDEIEPGDETSRLHRWGYRKYVDMFNARQLLGLELSCRLISRVADERIRRALATNLSDLLRYQNMLCRYDTMALKSLDIFSIHGFPVGLVQCESNLIGILTDQGANVGSGGWSNIVEKYAKAKRYCDAPFEVQYVRSRKVEVPLTGEWIGEYRDAGVFGTRRRISLRCQDAATAKFPPLSLDAVFTDPPYFGNVQYGELMNFCYVWLRRLVGATANGFDRDSTRDSAELTGNVTMDRGLEYFAQGLSAAFSNAAAALKPGAPLVFTYHHNKLEAYCAAGVAILDAGLICSASFPCPAEMGGSIHIHGTDSSVVDTVFVCRSGDERDNYSSFGDSESLARLIDQNIVQLRTGGLEVSRGNIRCTIYGHLTRTGVWKLRKSWDRAKSIGEKLRVFETALAGIGSAEEVSKQLKGMPRQDAGQAELFPPED